MLTIERSEKVLEENGTSMSREDIGKLRDFLYSLANLQLENENNEKNNESDECDFVL